MSKAVLVMNMPENCGSCMFPIRCMDELNCEPMLKDYENGLTEIDPIIEDEDEKPDWCPLRPLPEKKEEAKEPLATRYYRAEGWNDCLDEITGGTQ